MSYDTSGNVNRTYFKKCHQNWFVRDSVCTNLLPFVSHHCHWFISTSIEMEFVSLSFAHIHITMKTVKRCTEQRETQFHSIFKTVSAALYGRPAALFSSNRQTHGHMQWRQPSFLHKAPIVVTIIAYATQYHRKYTHTVTVNAAFSFPPSSNLSIPFAPPQPHNDHFYTQNNLHIDGKLIVYWPLPIYTTWKLIFEFLVAYRYTAD